MVDAKIRFNSLNQKIIIKFDLIMLTLINFKVAFRKRCRMTLHLDFDAL